MEEIYKTYPHNPPHLFLADTIYIVTGAFLSRHHIMKSDLYKALFCDVLFDRAAGLGWFIEAWAVLGNHYHFVAQSPENPYTLPQLIRSIHSITAIAFNRLDHAPGRRVWHNYWDSCITYQTSYLARLHYVHMNPVKHGVVEKAEDYPFCSYSWFLKNSDAEFRKKVMNQPIDLVNVEDGF